MVGFKHDHRTPTVMIVVAITEFVCQDLVLQILMSTLPVLLERTRHLDNLLEMLFRDLGCGILLASLLAIIDRECNRSLKGCASISSTCQ